VATGERQKIPVIHQADVLVAEGTLAGCVAAWLLARQEMKVAVVASGTSLPHDIVVALRPWAREADLAHLPAEFADLFRKCLKERADDGELILDLGKLALGVEDLLLDAGVRIYYGLRPCGVAKRGRRVVAVVFAGKPGLVAIQAGATVDCTPEARLAALAGVRLVGRAGRDGRVGVRYTMLCNERPPRELPAEGSAELIGQKAIAHGPYAEFRMLLAARGDEALRDAELVLRARMVAGNAGRALRAAKQWPSASFARGGDALLVETTRRIPTRSQEAELGPASCLPDGVDGLLVCSPAADVPDVLAIELADPFRGTALALAVARAEWSKVRSAGEGLTDAEVILTLKPVAAGRVEAAGRAEGGGRAEVAGQAAAGQGAATARARLGLSPALYGSGAELDLGQAGVPVVAECDVLVVGGGTSGLPAALVAAQNGAKTILIEKHSDLGGTQTLGGVSKYWFGRPTDFVRQLDRDALALLSGTGMPKSLAMLYSLITAGVSVLPQCQAAGVLLDGNAVKGIVVATPAGLAAIKANVVIDATGDGDVAAWAGADHSWGTGRDAMTLWFSFGHFVGPKSEASRQYHSAVDLRDASDFSRAIITARRRTGIFGQGDFPQYYLAPRESRHIKGRATVTYADILAGRRWPDTILVCEANFDIKGLASSDLALCGYTEIEFTRNYPAAIPYRALVPEKLQGILVVGKAYSITHDALSLARMQRDLMAMGGAAGLAAATAAKARCPVADVSVPELQKGLIKLGILRPNDLAEPPPAPADGELAALVRELAAGAVRRTDQVKLLARGDAVAPMLKAALADATPRGKVDLARALCLLGHADGVPVLLEELQRQLAADELPASPQKSHEAPDHGYAPEPAFLINAIGLARDRRLVPLLKPLAERIVISPKKSDDAFSYVFAICYACERIADPAAISALEVLADKPGIAGSAIAFGADPRKSLGHVAERHAYLELCVGRALARCGSPRGYDILIGYLRDMRGVLARSAHDELVELSGSDLGHSPEPWQHWLAQAPRPLPLKPFLKRLE